MEERQLAYLRRLGVRGRLEQGALLLDEGFNALWLALKRTHAGYTEEQLKVEWIRVHHGEELAARYARYLQCKMNNSVDLSAP